MRQGKPHVCRYIAFRHSCAIEVKLRESVPSLVCSSQIGHMFSSFAIPFGCCSIVLRHPFSIFVHLTQTCLGILVVLIGCESKPFQSFSKIWTSEPSLLVSCTQPELGMDIALHCRSSKPNLGLSSVRVGAEKIFGPKPFLGRRISLFRSLSPPCHSLARVF